MQADIESIQASSVKMRLVPLLLGFIKYHQCCKILAHILYHGFLLRTCLTYFAVTMNFTRGFVIYDDGFVPVFVGVLPPEVLFPQQLDRTLNTS